MFILDRYDKIWMYKLDGTQYLDNWVEDCTDIYDDCFSNLHEGLYVDNPGDGIFVSDIGAIITIGASGNLIIDEIDAHLHPSWQRRIIPALTRNFPNLQIFCSTHPPLMLAGLEEGQVQLISRDTKGHRRRVPQRGRYCGLVVRRYPAQHAGRARSN